MTNRDMPDLVREAIEPAIEKHRLDIEKKKEVERRGLALGSALINYTHDRAVAVAQGEPMHQLKLLVSGLFFLNEHKPGSPAAPRVDVSTKPVYFERGKPLRNGRSTGKNLDIKAVYSKSSTSRRSDTAALAVRLEQFSELERTKLSRKDKTASFRHPTSDPWKTGLNSRTSSRDPKFLKSAEINSHVVFGAIDGQADQSITLIDFRAQDTKIPAGTRDTLDFMYSSLANPSLNNFGYNIRRFTDPYGATQRDPSVSLEDIAKNTDMPCTDIDFSPFMPSFLSPHG